METTKKSKYNRKKNRYMTGEDIDMFHEREYYSQKEENHRNICDTHIDGA